MNIGRDGGSRQGRPADSIASQSAFRDSLRRGIAQSEHHSRSTVASALPMKSLAEDLKKLMKSLAESDNKHQIDSEKSSLVEMIVEGLLQRDAASIPDKGKRVSSSAILDKAIIFDNCDPYVSPAAFRTQLLSNFFSQNKRLSAFNQFEGKRKEVVSAETTSRKEVSV